jgi:hypothetical protein
VIALFQVAWYRLVNPNPAKNSTSNQVE